MHPLDIVFRKKEKLRKIVNSPVERVFLMYGIFGYVTHFIEFILRSMKRETLNIIYFAFWYYRVLWVTEQLLFQIK